MRSLCLQFRCGKLQKWGVVAPYIGGVIGDALLRDIVKEGEEPIKIALRERIELVVMAAGTDESLSEPDGGCCFNPIGAIFREKFLGNDPAFLINHLIAVETSGDALVEGGAGKKVPRELFHG